MRSAADRGSVRPGILGAYASALSRWGDRAAAQGSRRLLRVLLAALMGGADALLAGAWQASSTPAFLAFTALGLLAGGAAAIPGRGVAGWLSLWMFSGLAWGFALGEWEGITYALVWSVPGAFLGICGALVLWMHTQRLHEATARRLTNGLFGLTLMPVLCAVPLGLMGLLDLGWTDDVVGVMAMGAIAASLIGGVTGWRSVQTVTVECPACGQSNLAPANAVLSHVRCHQCCWLLQSSAPEEQQDTGADPGTAPLPSVSVIRAIKGTLLGLFLGGLVQMLICVPWGALLGAGKGIALAWLHGAAFRLGAVDGAIQGAWLGGGIGAVSGALVVAYARATAYLCALEPPAQATRAVGQPRQSPDAPAGVPDDIAGRSTARAARAELPSWAHGWHAAGAATLVLLTVLAVWDAGRADRASLTLRAHAYRTTSLSFSPDGRFLASGGEDDRAVIWDLGMGVPRVEITADRAVNAVAFSADGRYLAWSAGDTYTAWQEANDRVTLCTADGELVGHLEGHRNAVHALAFTADGKHLVTGSSDSTVIVWELSSRRPERVITTGEPVRRMALSCRTQLVAVSGADGRIQLVDTGAGDHVGALAGHATGTACMAFSPDGARLVTGGLDSRVKMWDVATGELLWETGKPVHVGDSGGTGHRGYVLAVAYAPDGATVASGGEYGAVRLWDSASGRAVGVLGGARFPLTLLLGGHAVGVRALVFSPDGRRLASGDEDGMIKLWHTAPR